MLEDHIIVGMRRSGSNRVGDGRPEGFNSRFVGVGCFNAIISSGQNAGLYDLLLSLAADGEPSQARAHSNKVSGKMVMLPASPKSLVLIRI